MISVTEKEQAENYKAEEWWCIVTSGDIARWARWALLWRKSNVSATCSSPCLISSSPISWNTRKKLTNCWTEKCDHVLAIQTSVMTRAPLNYTEIQGM
jgi:hypothetical protein